MQRFFNEADFIVDDMLDGYVKAFEDRLAISSNNNRVVYSKDIKEDTVSIISGGGSGHEPCFLGYVGEGMLDAAAVGEVFSSPTAVAFYEAIKASDKGKGVAVLFGNYAGDNMNVKIACKMAQKDGIEVKYLAANDDVASAPKEDKAKRHGIAASPLVWKIAKAKALKGANLDEVIEVAQKVIDNVRSVCVGLSPCTIPAVGHPNFKIDEGTLEYGIGHHGEPGTSVEPLTNANEIARRLCTYLDDDFNYQENDEITIVLSNLGTVPMMELYVLYNAIHDYFKDKKVTIYQNLIGNYVTSLDMNGVALTVLKMDDELKELLASPCKTAGLTI